MRSIKFRVWDKNRRGFLFHSRNTIDSQNLWLSLEGTLTSVTRPNHEIENFIIQQFTGLKDVDGVDIYEGDFVELWTVANQKAPNMRGLYEIIWGRTGFDLKCHKTAAGDIWFQLQKDKSFENTDGSYFVPSKIVIDTLPLRGFNICKVVGNIFEVKDETN